MSETILPPVSWDCLYQLGNPGAACTTESIETHDDDPAAHGQTAIGRAVVTAADSAEARAALEIPASSTSVVATGSTTDRTFAQRFADVANVLDFGAQGTNAEDGFDSLAAFNAALATGRPVYVPPPPSGSYYRVSDTVIVANGRGLFGPRGGVVRIMCTHATPRPVVTVNGSGGQYIANLWLSVPVASQQGSSAIMVDGGAHPNAITKVLVENIYASGHKYGIWVRGAAYFCKFQTLTLLNCLAAPIRLDDRDGTALNNSGVSSGPNSNTFILNELTGQSIAPPGTDSAAVQIQRGSLNTFIGGELGTTSTTQQLDYLVVIENGNSNRFIGCYAEAALNSTTKLMKLGDGVQVHWQSAGFVQGLDLGTDARIVSAGGADLEYNNSITQRSLNWQDDCSALYFCNEGSGTVLLDHSGNGRHVYTAAATWSDGKSGKAFDINLSESKYLNLDSLAPVLTSETVPFTVVALFKRTGAVGNPVFMHFSGGTRYLRVLLNDTFKEFTDYNGTTATTVNPLGGMKASQNDGYQWIAFTVDVAAGTVKWLDPVVGPRSASAAMSPFIAGGGTGVTQMRLANQYGTSGVTGSLCFLGFWNRALDMSEVLDLVNMKTPALWAGKAQQVQKVAEYAVEGAATTRTQRYGSGAPVSGTWRIGDIVWNTAPTPGWVIGWVCTTAGTPGTWKSFGAISA